LPETKAVAYEYVPFHEVYARGVDVENQRTPFTYSATNDSQMTDAQALPRHLDEVKGGKELVATLRSMTPTAYVNNNKKTQVYA
jgi:hypothetical protein